MAIRNRRGNMQAQRPQQGLGRVCLALGAALIVLTLGWPLAARTARDSSRVLDPAQSCLAAAAQAATAEGVPLDILVTLSLVESGRDTGAGLAPWPWAIHAQGRGHWPTQRADALAIAQAARDAGATNIDLGCFQINFRWHGAEFPTLDAMLDPVTNARYAARLLRAHRDRLGSWDAAVGAYHSRTPELAAKYSARFARLAAYVPALVQGIAEPPPPDPHQTGNTTPQLAHPPGAGAIALYIAGQTRPLLDLARGQP